MRVRFLIGLLAASIPVVAGASSALAQREDERYLHLEQMRSPASPRPRPRSEEPPPRAAPQAGQQAPSGFFGGPTTRYCNGEISANGVTLLHCGVAAR